ncbi:MAG: adenylate/guanylate cyclase domain-containing protein [Bdellovibrionales bacterium]
MLQQVEDLIEGGSDIEQIRSKIRSDRTVSTIFVDICSFGEMTAQMSSTIVYETRTFVFKKLSDILAPHHLYFVKPMGDSAHFCGGIGDDVETQTETATNCIRGVIQILDSIDKINLRLREQDLPGIELKVSATLGHAEFGLEGTSNDLRFDVQGHWINMAKRLEDAMNSDFYQKYGKNCALVSENLFKFCKDIRLQERFALKHNIKDKHSIVINARVGQQYPDQINRDDALEAIYGQFAHKSKNRKASG